MAEVPWNEVADSGQLPLHQAPEHVVEKVLERGVPSESLAGQEVEHLLLVLQLHRPHRRRVGQHAAHPRAARLGREHQRHRAIGAAAMHSHTRIQRICMVWACQGAVPVPLPVRLILWARAYVGRVRA